jgi:D-aminopeptidase
MLSVLIIADIEGSTGCERPSDSKLFNDGWVKACVDLTIDINTIVGAIFATGKVGRVRVKDFHRTGFNIFADQLDKRIDLSQGYDCGPIVGIGDCAGFDLLFLTGLHAASGSKGFIPHTLTSRFSAIRFNGRLITEAELFSASVAKAGLQPVFFSGESLACQQALMVMPWLQTFAIDKPLSMPKNQLRSGMAARAVEAIESGVGQVYSGAESGQVEVFFRDGKEAAKKAGKTWGLDWKEDSVSFSVDNLNQAYRHLIEMAYLTPFWNRHLKMGLKLFNFWGRLTHVWAKRRRKVLQLS